MEIKLPVLVSVLSLALSVFVLCLIPTLWRSGVRVAAGLLTVLGMPTAMVAILLLFTSSTWAADGVGRHPAPWLVTAVVGGAIAYIVSLVIQQNRGIGIMAAGAVLFLAPWPAAAGDGQTFPIVLPKELVTTLLDAALMATWAGLIWLIKRGAEWLNISRESKQVGRLEDGMNTALMYAHELALLAGKDIRIADVRSELVATAANYLLPKMPGTMKALKIDQAGLRERLTARLGYVAPHGAATGLSSPVLSSHR